MKLNYYSFILCVSVLCLSASGAISRAQAEDPATGDLGALPPPPASTTIPASAEVIAVTSPAPYYIDRGVTMVPLRPVSDFLQINVSALDGVLTFIHQAKSEASIMKVVTLRMGGRTARIVQGSASSQLPLALPPETRLGNTFVPLAFLRESFGVTIGFRARDNALVLRDGARVGVLTPPAFVEYGGSNAATVTITNRVGRALSLRLSGPQSVILELGQGQSVTRRVKPGVYYYQAGSADMKPRSGARRLVGGRRATWSWGRR